MAKLKNMEPIIKTILEGNERAREDNFILYVEVLKNFISVDRLTFEEVCVHHIQLGIPSLETITRCRRKIQEKHPELLSEKAAKKRAEEESEYIAYSRS